MSDIKRQDSNSDVNSNSSWTVLDDDHQNASDSTNQPHPEYKVTDDNNNTITGGIEEISQHAEFATDSTSSKTSLESCDSIENIPEDNSERELTIEEFLEEHDLDCECDNFKGNGAVFDDMIRQNKKCDKKKRKKCKAESLATLTVIGAVVALAGVSFICMLTPQNCQPSPHVIQEIKNNFKSKDFAKASRENVPKCQVNVADEGNALNIVDRANIFGNCLNKKVVSPEEASSFFKGNKFLKNIKKINLANDQGKSNKRNTPIGPPTLKQFLRTLPRGSKLVEGEIKNKKPSREVSKDNRDEHELKTIVESKPKKVKQIVSQSDVKEEAKQNLETSKLNQTWTNRTKCNKQANVKPTSPQLPSWCKPVVKSSNEAIVKPTLSQPIICCKPVATSSNEVNVKPTPSQPTSCKPIAKSLNEPNVKPSQWKLASCCKPAGTSTNAPNVKPSQWQLASCCKPVGKSSVEPNIKPTQSQLASCCKPAGKSSNEANIKPMPSKSGSSSSKSSNEDAEEINKEAINFSTSSITCNIIQDVFLLKMAAKYAKKWQAKVKKTQAKKTTKKSLRLKKMQQVDDESSSSLDCMTNELKSSLKYVNEKKVKTESNATKSVIESNFTLFKEPPLSENKFVRLGRSRTRGRPKTAQERVKANRMNRAMTRYEDNFNETIDNVEESLVKETPSLVKFPERKFHTFNHIPQTSVALSVKTDLDNMRKKQVHYLEQLRKQRQERLDYVETLRKRRQEQIVEILRDRRAKMMQLKDAASGNYQVPIQNSVEVAEKLEELRRKDDQVPSWFTTYFCLHPTNLKSENDVSTSTACVDCEQIRRPGGQQLRNSYLEKKALSNWDARNLFSSDESDGQSNAPALTHERKARSTQSCSLNKADKIYPVATYSGFIKGSRKLSSDCSDEESEVDRQKLQKRKIYRHKAHDYFKLHKENLEMKKQIYKRLDYYWQKRQEYIEKRIEVWKTADAAIKDLVAGHQKQVAPDSNEKINLPDESCSILDTIINDVVNTVKRVEEVKENVDNVSNESSGALTESSLSGSSDCRVIVAKKSKTKKTDALYEWLFEGKAQEIRKRDRALWYFERISNRRRARETSKHDPRRGHNDKITKNHL